MTTILLDTKRLRAAAMASKSDGFRTSDNVVCIDIASTGHVYIVGTNGTTLYVGLNDMLTAPGAPRRLVIERIKIETAVKWAGKAAHIELVLGDIPTLGTLGVPPRETYPLWRKAANTIDATAPLGYQRLDPALVAAADKVLRTATGIKNHTVCLLRTFASDTPPAGELVQPKNALMTVSGHADYVVISPMAYPKAGGETFEQPRE